MESILESSSKDRWYLIYSSLSGFVLVAIYFLLKDVLKIGDSASFFSVFIVFALLFDVRHFFPTYTRTILDKSFMKENKGWFLSSWAFILLVPIVAMMLMSSSEFRAFDSYLIFSFTLRFTYIIGFYHLIKQNWGFMAIFKKKNGEKEDGSDKWEKLALLSGSFLPFVYVSLKNPVWFEGGQYIFAPKSEQLPYILNFWQNISLGLLILGFLFILISIAFKSIPQFKYVSRNLSGLFFGLFILVRWILVSGKDVPLYSIMIFLGLIFIYSLYKSISMEKIRGHWNKEKWMIFISSLVLYNGILLLPIENKFIMIMAITIPHNIQYLGFTGAFNQRYYLNSKKEHGLAKVLSEKAVVFFLLSVFYAFVFELSRTGIKYVDWFDSNDTLRFVRNIIGIFFLAMVWHHYYLDAVIWRVRKDKDLSENI
ncbi:MAG: hypothetical protein EP305_09835 [Bacteroidetes bacterium]|nr:MAG: hypothetical protein EP305_09835 [Bacteroidota bacterium]